MTISELLEHVKDGYQVNHKKTHPRLEARCRLHLLPCFGNSEKGATNAANPHLHSLTNAAQRHSLEGIP